MNARISRLAALAWLTALGSWACATPTPTAEPAATPVEPVAAPVEPAYASAEPDDTRPAPNPDDPYDPRNWIPLLDERAELRNAVTQLQRLRKEPGIEAAIEPLARVWERENQPKKILQVIIEIAEEGHGGPHWPLAMPTLENAVDRFDPGDLKSVDNAILAADALSRTGMARAVPVLARAVARPLPRLSPGQRVRLAAMSALGHFGSDERAVAALLAVLSADAASQPPQIFAAAALALVDNPRPEAIEPLLLKLFEIPPIYTQCWRALVNIGPPARDRLLSVFEGRDPVLQDLATRLHFATGCDLAMGPDTQCQAPGNLRFKSALLLGDFYASEAVEPLLRGLGDKPVPAYFQGSLPGPVQHTAILDALKKIGDTGAADRVFAYAAAPSTSDELRPLAIDTYSFLATDTTELARLARWFADERQPEHVRLASALAYARLARSKRDYKPLERMIARYRKAAGKRRADPERAAIDRGHQRSFEQALARAHVGVVCTDDPRCLADVVARSPADLGSFLGPRFPDWAKKSAEEQKDLAIAATERALLDLRKLGARARPAMDVLLAQVESRDRITREGVLLALVKVASLPCDACVTRLSQVIEEQRDQTTLHSMTLHTEAVLGYFRWAGR